MLTADVCSSCFKGIRQANIIAPSQLWFHSLHGLASFPTVFHPVSLYKDVLAQLKFLVAIYFKKNTNNWSRNQFPPSEQNFSFIKYVKHANDYRTWDLPDTGNPKRILGSPAGKEEDLYYPKGLSFQWCQILPQGRWGYLTIIENLALSDNKDPLLTWLMTQEFFLGVNEHFPFFHARIVAWMSW